MSLNNLGAVPASTTIYLYWTSHDLATGANETMSGLAVGDILIYKNGSTTQRSSTSGFTLLDTDGIDFDALTGVNGVSIDLSDNTDAGFYAVGSWYTVILGPVTIDTQTVYVNLATFRIIAAEVITGKPKVDVDGWLGTAAATPTVAGVPEVDLTHVAGATTNVAALATNVDAILTDTADMQPKLGTPADTDLATDIANLSAEHTLQNGTLAEISAALGNDTIQTATIGTTGNDTTHLHVPDFTYGDDEINDYLMVVRDASTGNRYARWVADWVNSTKLATVATLPFTPENSTDQVILLAIRRDSGLTAAETRAAVGLASANLDTQLTAIDDYIDTEVAAIKAKTDLIPASPAATSDIPSAATIADAVWDEALSGHTTAGSGGKSLSDIDTHTDTEVASILAAVDTEVAAIKAKTDQLTFTTANQVDATTMSMAANALTAAATASDFGTEVATAVWASATRTLSALGFTLSASDLAADTIGASELAADAVTEIVNAVLTTAMTESYNADGAAPTLAQAMFLCMQRLTEFAISGTTVTVKKLDGSTTAYTLTLDDATSPTSSTRAT